MQHKDYRVANQVVKKLDLTLQVLFDDNSYLF